MVWNQSTMSFRFPTKLYNCYFPIYNAFSMGYIAFTFVHLSEEYFCGWFVNSFPSIWYKQCYASQLYDWNSASITKTLLMQMPQMSFTQFHNKLAQVLGTHQQTGNKASAKTVTTSAVEAEPEEKSSPAKSKTKKDAKISGQSMQIFMSNWTRQWQKTPKSGNS